MDNQAISEIVGLCPTHISTVWKKYQRGGLEAIKPRVRGRRLGDKRELTAEQEVGIQKLLVNQNGQIGNPVGRVNALEDMRCGKG